MGYNARNLLLTALPSRVAHSLWPSLKRAVLSPRQVLFDVREPIGRVYFPVNAVVSLLIPLSNGQAVETAMVGRDGVIGAVCTENLIHIDDMRESPKLTRWLRFYALCLRSWPHL
jgi:hypothetical protein